MLLTTTFRPARERTQYPLQLVAGGSLSEGNAAGAVFIAEVGNRRSCTSNSKSMP
jgi:hypothetical protein